MPKITHILFDCDNTLVLSEHLAFAACADLANTLLATHSSPPPKTRYTGADLLEEFVGQNFRGMLLSLQKKHAGFTLSPAELDESVAKEEDAVIAKLKDEATPCVNCNAELERLYNDGKGKYGLAVVSSSALRRVKVSLAKAGQTKFFPPEHIFSAASSLPTPTTKPDPAIYIHACRILGKEPGECVAVEDSKSGVTSAIRAGVNVIGYVGCYPAGEKQRQVREMMDGLGVKVVMGDWKEFGGCLKRVEGL